MEKNVKRIIIVNIRKNEVIDLSKFTFTFIAENWVRGYWEKFEGFPIVFAPFNGYKVIVEN